MPSSRPSVARSPARGAGSQPSPRGGRQSCALMARASDRRGRTATYIRADLPRSIGNMHQYGAGRARRLAPRFDGRLDCHPHRCPFAPPHSVAGATPADENSGQPSVFCRAAICSSVVSAEMKTPFVASACQRATWATGEETAPRRGPGGGARRALDCQVRNCFPAHPRP